VRKRTDRLHIRSLGPRELEALRLIEERPDADSWPVP
jgi:hypothetical protein